MAYNKNTWTDRSTEYENRYQMTENQDNTVTLTPVTGTIYNEGTLINASKMNNIENQLSIIGKMAKIYLSAQATYSPNTDFTIPFDSISPNQDSTLFELYNNGIKVKKACNILISARATCFDESGVTISYIKVNGNNLTVSFHRTEETIKDETVIAVNAGDVITYMLRTENYVSAKIIQNQASQTHLQITCLC